MGVITLLPVRLESFAWPFSDDGVDGGLFQQRPTALDMRHLQRWGRGVKMEPHFRRDFGRMGP